MESEIINDFNSFKIETIETQQTVADLLADRKYNAEHIAVINKETKLRMELDEVIEPNQTVIFLKAIKGG